MTQKEIINLLSKFEELGKKEFFGGETYFMYGISHIIVCGNTTTVFFNPSNDISFNNEDINSLFLMGIVSCIKDFNK